MNKFLIPCLVCLFLLGWINKASALEMAPYFPSSEGRGWIFDREILLISGKSHAFANATGQELCQASVLKTTFYLDNGPQGVRLVGVYDRPSGQFDDMSPSPAVLATANMNVGQSLSSTLPGGVTVKSTLEAVENVTVPAGTFPDALRFAIDIKDVKDGQTTCTYREHIWVARETGFIKLERVSETPANCAGCFLTCGGLDETSTQWVSRVQQLDKAVKPTNKVVVIPH